MKTKLIALILMGLMSTSCAYDANFRSYVMAHRLQYNANVLLKTKVVDTNPALSVDDKDTFKSNIQAEDEMITNAEKLLGIRK